MSGVGSVQSSAIEKIARRGLRAIFGAETEEEARSAGGDALDEASAASPSPVEDAIIGAARDVNGLTLYDGSALAAQRVAFNALSNHWKGDVAHVLGELGRKMMDGAQDTEDGRAIGNAVLERVAALPSPIARAVNRATAESMYDDSAVAAQRVALDLIAASPAAMGVTALLAHLARRGMDGAQDEEDSRTIGHAVLQEMRDSAPDAPDRDFASDVVTVTSESMYDASALAAQRAAFEHLESPARDTPEQRLASFGIKASNGAADDEDAYNIAGATLTRITDRTSWDTIKGLADLGKRQGDAAEEWADGAQRLRDSLQRIQGLAGAALSNGPESRDALAAMLEENIARNRQEILEEEAAIQATSGEVSRLDARIQDLMQQMPALESIDALAMKRLKIGGIATTGGLITGLGGLIAATAAPIAPAISWTIAAIGGVSAAVGMYVVKQSSDRHHEVTRELIPLTAHVYSLSAQRDSLASDQSSRRATVEGLEEIIRKDQSQLDVMRMASAVTGKPAEGTVEVGQQTVTIGGITVPRKS